ncbi:hypothetical protein AX17_004578 [Amanita inopinata Kibby_2008]|nr:hypothetical protein AX17_004578 [Amanita inopinata Kibby_2008]
MKNKDVHGSSPDNVKRITDYFMRKPGGIQERSVVASSSRVVSSSMTANLLKREETITLRKSARLTSVHAKTDRATSTSSKRVRSPDTVLAQNRNPVTNGFRSKSRKRQRKFESDSDVDMSDSRVVYVRSPVRASVSNDVMDHDVVSVNELARSELVPTSQSDEVELCLVPPFMRDVDDVKRCVEQWRRQETPPRYPDVPEFDALNIQACRTDLLSSPLSSVPATPNSLLVPDDISAHSPCSAAIAPRIQTPPIPDHPSALTTVPLSPVPLDEGSKTAWLIEKIKAEALARVQRLEDSPPLRFNETLDSSSDEESSFDALIYPKRKSDSAISDTATYVAEPTSCESQRPESPTSRKLARLSSHTVSPLSRVTNIPPNAKHEKAAVRKSAKQPNPLDVLLSEKRRLQKAGVGAKAFEDAESALNIEETLFKELQVENQYGEDFPERWLGEDEAQKAGKDVLAFQSSSPNERRLLDVPLRPEDTVRIIGRDGERVAEILKHDHVHEDQVELVLHTSGLRLWLDHKSEFDRSYSHRREKLSFEYHGEQPMIGLLKAALDEQDDAQAIMLLDSGILSHADLSRSDSLVTFLCAQAFCWPPSVLTLPAFRTLVSIYSHVGTNAVPFSVGHLVHAFVNLGADPVILEKFGLSVNIQDNGMAINSDERTNIILRLIHLVTIAIQSRRVELADLPDIAIALLLAFLDPSASYEVRADITKSIDDVCKLGTTDMERQICQKVTLFVAALEAACKARVVSVFSNGSGSTRRIARWVAYLNLTNQSTLREDHYSDVPPLKDLLDVLEAGRIFEIHDNSDYITLGHYVQILGIALTDVELYNAAERQTCYKQEEAKLAQYGSPSKIKNKHKILLIHEALERLHARIQDTRALHLDRSRVKAAIKQLSLCLRYQYSDSAYNPGLGIGAPRKKTLHHFFSPKKA